ncbi:MAG: hypothetical protein E7G36_00435 [Peptoniphilus rhinitidis]|uniref:hypothetical protein n=1 Tax=Peptoniphilus rhinitidis TaxID=1175452 RepID=UPI002900F1DE|nr:hypothetical protein [Peptoniphilus rhinitidis]MDU2108978.1 hypothetical protein [Peptoniphilus lacydonensis]MDU3750171.1 hypothetical protein [Peptoniphilus rhinitidis]
MVDLNGILKKFTELKLEEEVLQDRFKEIKEEKAELLSQLKNVNKDDISRRMDDLLPYHLEYEFLQKNLKEISDIDSLADMYTDKKEHEVKEEYTDNPAGSFVDINVDYNDKENSPHIDEEDEVLKVPQLNTDIIEDNITHSYTDSKEDINTSDVSNIRDNNDGLVLDSEDLSTPDAVEEEKQIITEDVEESNLQNEPDKTKDINTDINTEDVQEEKTEKKQKVLFKDLSTEDKIKYIISIIDMNRSKVKEIIEFWNVKDNPEQKNQGLIILRDLRRVKETLYDEEQNKIKENITVEIINDVLTKLQNIKEDIESYSFVKEREEINDKYED